ncbi:MAG: hypothetical protein V4574_06870 [Pseudomonadota bacterium]
MGGLGTEIPEEKQTVRLGMTDCLWVKDEPLVIWLTALGETSDARDHRSSAKRSA